MASPSKQEELLLLLILLCSLQAWPCFVSSANIVTHLPGFNGELPFYMETGYITVDESSGSELFYYFIESENRPREDPLLLWLTGGPACSSFCGLVTEIGPIKFNIVPFNSSDQKSLPTFISNPYSWTKLSSIIFLDWIVGSGFSFSPSPQDYSADDFLSSENIHRFIQKWLLDHPQFISNPFYLAGDSYGGKIAPVVAQKLEKGNNSGRQPVVNLKGYIIGNPVVNEEEEYRLVVEFALGMGIISHEFFMKIRESCAGDLYLFPKKKNCAANLDIFDEISKELQLSNILEPLCFMDFDPWAKRLGQPMKRSGHSPNGLFSPPPVPEIDCPCYDLYLSYHWTNNQVVQQALHIKEGKVKEWLRCNFDLNYSKNIESSLLYHLNITKNNKYRALIYSGDHDMLVPYISTIEWINLLNYSVINKWRSWHVDGQVAGYTVMYSNNVSFATVKGGSHTAPKNRPKECFEMFQRWIYGMPL